MKKVIVGFLAAGAIVGLLAAARRMGREMSKHAEQMAAHCKQMVGQTEKRREPVGTA